MGIGYEAIILDLLSHEFNPFTKISAIHLLYHESISPLSDNRLLRVNSAWKTVHSVGYKLQVLSFPSSATFNNSLRTLKRPPLTEHKSKVNIGDVLMEKLLFQRRH